MRGETVGNILADLADAQAQRDLLAQAMWDMATALGFDTDGDKIPGHMISGMGYAGFAKAMLDVAKEARDDYEEALECTCGMTESSFRCCPLHGEKAKAQ